LTAWFFATLAPAFTVLLRRSASAPVADRYLYLPSVASCLLLTWAIVRLCRTSAVGHALRSPCSSWFPDCGHARVSQRVWADDLLRSDVAAKVPDDALPHLNRRHCNAATGWRGRTSAASARRKQTAVRAMSHNALGNLYRRQTIADAARALETGIQTIRIPPSIITSE
jgi:hypothetical protein